VLCLTIQHVQRIPSVHHPLAVHVCCRHALVHVSTHVDVALNLQDRLAAQHTLCDGGGAAAWPVLVAVKKA
jgi:hypothetical protein